VKERKRNVNATPLEKNPLFYDFLKESEFTFEKYQALDRTNKNTLAMLSDFGLQRGLQAIRHFDFN
jgi:hypothetical protein